MISGRDEGDDGADEEAKCTGNRRKQSIGK